MAKVSVSEAARIAGISRSYFYRKYINTGKLTVEKDKDDKPVIDKSELFRVFGKIQVEDGQGSRTDTPEKDSRIATLEAELALKDELLKGAKDHIADLQQSLKLLAYRPAEPVPESKPNLSEPVPAQEKKGIKLFGLKISWG
ncbi:MAG: hypothetical protein M0Z78_05835 [Betaproteobacteria bacterium]|nr:hypothetical protein [Betaproteobacteria bacterium]